ncbi:unnamed protein product, partial [Heterosigma akashiwo]
GGAAGHPRAGLVRGSGGPSSRPGAPPALARTTSPTCAGGAGRGPHEPPPGTSGTASRWPRVATLRRWRPASASCAMRATSSSGAARPTTRCSARSPGGPSSSTRATT